MAYRIMGRVVEKDTRRGIGELVVQAWDKDAGSDDFLGKATTRNDGWFEIIFNDFIFREWFLGDLHPDVYFKVFRGGTEVASTEDSVIWNLKNRNKEVTLEVDLPEEEAGWVERHVYLKIERIEDYNPVFPEDKTLGMKEYGRDCMRNTGHETGRIPQAEIGGRELSAVVYREYWDAGYLTPKTGKIVAADINEPVYSRRVPGTVIYTYPGDILHIHVWNCDKVPHSFHTHGLDRTC